jgi:putative addiction module killer protein
MPFEVFRYRSCDGSEPVSEWLAALPDKAVQARLRMRLNRIAAGSLGDHASVGDGVFELREHFGAGFRIYFGMHGRAIIILLCAGSERTQATDIRIAREFWNDWKRRQ